MEEHKELENVKHELRAHERKDVQRENIAHSMLKKLRAEHIQEHEHPYWGK